MFLKQPPIDEGCEVFTPLRGQFKALMNVIGQVPAPRTIAGKLAAPILEKKERGQSPAQKLCRPFIPEVRFVVAWRGDAAFARQGSSRDLDHQTVTLRVV
jgi:hypothetical protein